MSNEEIIFNTVKERGYSDTLANLLIAQAKHETGNFKSNAFIKFNNAFGYKRYAGSKWQIGSGNISTEGNAYAAYDQLSDSVNEVLDWLKRRQNEGKLVISQLTTPEAYALALKNSGYFGASVNEYIQGLKFFLTNFTSTVKDIVKKNKFNLLTIVLLGTAIYYLSKK
jgi:hypothetical protein